MRRLEKYLHLEARYKVLLLQAWCLLGWFRLSLLVLPLRRLTRKLHHHASPVPAVALPAQQREEARAIGALVAAAARTTPWQSRCLVQVLVVQHLLAVRGVTGQFYLGVRPGSENGEQPRHLAAHAWLQCDDLIVNGEAGHEQYSVISTFSWSPGAMQK